MWGSSRFGENARFFVYVFESSGNARVTDVAFPFSSVTGAHFRIRLRSATNRDEYNGVPVSHYRVAAEQKRCAYMFDWIIRNRPAEIVSLASTER